MAFLLDTSILVRVANSARIWFSGPFHPTKTHNRLRIHPQRPASGLPPGGNPSL